MNVSERRAALQCAAFHVTDGTGTDRTGPERNGIGLKSCRSTVQKDPLTFRLSVNRATGPKSKLGSHGL